MIHYTEVRAGASFSMRTLDGDFLIEVDSVEQQRETILVHYHHINEREQHTAPLPIFAYHAREVF